MDERYEKISGEISIEWYLYNDVFFIPSLNSGFNSNKWMFCYAPTKEIMDKMLGRQKSQP